ncbi:fibronectin type III domain-containing protein 2 [Elsinoe australis]|uniref:Fibronectin type III domain-containing protein 2 n=1 Tax=Elsinoe australis TaxID=40998 RepID=A0A4U7AQE0_9PEZI|nr:fibronectin type III domain-containing protein 2 [Elsinoe australis]
MLVSLTVGKVDAGVAVLLTEDKRLIEFPSILLPPDISSGSIVDIDVSRNFKSEQIASQKFDSLQEEIYSTFGQATPAPPVLRCRNATQTSVVLEWDPVSIATAELRSLSLYRNGSKAGNIPRDKLSTKISGLQVDHEYTFHLVLRTSAGTFTSERLTVSTQKMTDLTGITITPGIMPQPLRDSLEETVNKIGAKLIDTVRIDTTHFVCTEGRGQAWEKALEMNVPVVVPDWLKGCEREGRIVGVRGYYLNADPKLRQVSQMTINTAQNQSHTSLPSATQGESDRVQNLRAETPRIEHTPPTPEQTGKQREKERREEEERRSEPPTPPPKMEAFPDAPTEMEEDSEPEDEGQETHERVKTEEKEIDDDEGSEASEATEKADGDLGAGGAQNNGSAGDGEKGKKNDEEEGGFDEVSL